MDTLTLMRRPPGDNPIQMLTNYRVPVAIGEAINYLYSLHDPLVMASLYKHYFPDEFDASALSLGTVQGGPYTETEWEFFKLVHDRLFPLEWHYLQCADARFSVIPVVAQGIDWDEDLDLTDLRPGLQLLLRLYMWTLPTYDAGPHEYEAGDLDPELEEDLAALLDGCTITVDWRELFDSCGRLGKKNPLRHLRLAFDAIAHDTGCVWFDADRSYHIIKADWDTENMDWLAGEWKEYCEKAEQIKTLVVWLEESANNMRTALLFWSHFVEGLDPEGQDRLQAKCDRLDPRQLSFIRPKTLAELYAPTGRRAEITW